MAKKNKTKKQDKKQVDLDALRAQDAAKKEQAAAEKQKKRRKTILTAVCCIGGAAVLAGAGFGIYKLKSGGSLQKQIIAETAHYQVNAAMFACYFRQCEDSYLSYAAGNDSMAVFDETKSLKDQNYKDDQTWYDMFMDNTMSSVESNLQLCEAAYADGFTLSESDLETCRTTAEQTDFSNYQKGVTAADFEQAMQLTLLAQRYQADAQEKLNVTDEEVAKYYQAHSEDYLSVSVLGYSFPWDPQTIIDGDATQHDAALDAAEALSKTKTQQEYTDYVFHYLTDEKKIAREEAEQMAGDLVITKMVTEFPEDVQEWIRGGAQRGETLLLPKEEQCNATVYMLRDTPTADDSKTVDFRIIFLNAAEYDNVDEAEKFAKELQEEVKAADDPSAKFAEAASEYSQDQSTYANGGLVSAYSAIRTTYGDEVSAWAFDRSRKQGDMVIVKRSSAVILAFFEGENEHSSWENEVRNDMLQQMAADFTEKCRSNTVTKHEDRYQYVTG